MIGIDARAARYTWTAVLILLLIWTVYVIRETLFVFAVSLLFAYLLWPLVEQLNRRLPGRSRTPALVIVYAALVALLVLGGFAIGSRIVVEANALVAKLPDLLANLQKPILPVSIPGIGSLKANAISDLRAQLAQHSGDIFSLLSGASLKALSAATNLVFFFLVPILSFFFVKDADEMRASLLAILSAGSHSDLVKGIAADLHLLLAQYMRALLLLAAVAFAAYAVFLSIIGVPYALLLAAIAFPLEFIPVVGPLTAVVIILAVAGFSGVHHWLWIAVYAGLFRLFQDYFLAPRLMSAGTELHPLLVIFGVLAGGEIAGVAGSLLSVPILATLRIVYQRLRKRTITVGEVSHSAT
jgi:predicted PurR-regulated permease PerM